MVNLSRFIYIKGATTRSKPLWFSATDSAVGPYKTQHQRYSAAQLLQRRHTKAQQQNAGLLGTDLFLGGSCDYTLRLGQEKKHINGSNYVQDAVLDKVMGED